MRTGPVTRSRSLRAELGPALLPAGNPWVPKAAGPRPRRQWGGACGGRRRLRRKDTRGCFAAHPRKFQPNFGRLRRRPRSGGLRARGVEAFAPGLRSVAPGPEPLKQEEGRREWGSSIGTPSPCGSAQAAAAEEATEKMPALRPALLWALLALWLCCATPAHALQCRDGYEPCVNEGMCVTYHNGTGYCKCPEGFLGEYCQHRDPCEKNRCQNGGTCVAQAMLGKATCRCASGFTGEDCQYSTSHPCFVSRPCLNGGTCHMLSRDTYECTCQVGFTGKECQWTDACLSHPCANGSTCTTVANQFSCKCLTGFTGQKCETDVNECDIPGHCQHGGICLNLPGSYQCQCLQGFTGQYCDSLYVPCAPSPCVNGGTCRQTGDFTFECNCLPETVRRGTELWERDREVWNGKEHDEN
eukprot:XP_011508558.1 notch homolog 2 N-terminal-like protein isoform X1 [Homo sapiens]